MESVETPSFMSFMSQLSHSGCSQELAMEEEAWSQSDRKFLNLTRIQQYQTIYEPQG
jgi:hypothetical protein